MNTNNTLLAITYQPRVFTNPALNKATERIAKLYLDAKNYAEDKNRTLASILAEVKVKELYKDDGFSSVADYAEATFGIKRANAYTLAAAGEVYNDKTASDALKAFTPSKLFEVVNVPREELECDIEGGVVTSETTQKDLREYASKKKEVAGTDKPVVLDRFNAYPWTREVSTDMADLFSQPHTMGEWEELISVFILPEGGDPKNITVTKLPKAKYPGLTAYENSPTLSRLMFHYEGEWNFLVVAFEKFKSSKGTKSRSSKNSKGAMSAEQLHDLLMSQPGVSDEAVKAALAAIYGATQQTDAE